MRLTIEQIKIQNFKGIRELMIDFASNTTAIYGMNGVGKTSIADAFSWVLWNKDSHGNAPGTDNFREKPVDSDGNEIHNLDIMVELNCKLDGKPFNLRRVQRENWVKKRGSSEAIYQGNVSTYWINEVETKLTDFKARIAAIASDEVSRLIGSLSAFNAIEWKKRRQQLLELSGIDVDAALLQRDEYRPIADEAAERGVDVDDLRKILVDQRKRVNTEIQMIPVRIDEARKALPTFGPSEIRDAEYMVQDMEKTLAQVDEMIATEKAQSVRSGVKERISLLEAEFISLKRRIVDTHRVERGQYEEKASNAAGNCDRAKLIIAELTRQIESDKRRLERAKTERNTLRSQYTAKYEQKFEYPDIGTCPTCGQEIPHDQHKSAMDAAFSRFDADQKAALEEIRKKGLEVSREANELAESIARMEADLADQKRREQDANAEANSAWEKAQALAAAGPDYDAEPRLVELSAQIEALRGELDDSPEEKIERLEARRDEVKGIIARSKAVLARRDAALATEKRIKDLETQLQAEAEKVAGIERMIALVEQFVQNRCTALEESINSRFPTVRWKLFDVQINGGIADTCICMVPCESGLVAYDSANTASQVHADLEIIDVLSKHYDVSLPIIVDGAERCNWLPPVNSQLISLTVSTDESLRVEHGKVEGG